MMSSILIIAGEDSGDKYGARLVREFKKLHSSASFFGIGGREMEKEGVDLLYSVRDMAVVGVFEIVSHLPRLRKIFNHLKKEIARKKPIASVLIDSPDFNLRLAKKLKQRSIPVLYFISPTVWAWRRGRLKTIKKTVSKMLLIFPFEERIYREHKIPAVYIGHPLIESLNVTLSKKEFCQKHGIDPQQRILAILPGSRKSEVKFHMPVLVEAIEKIQDEFSVQFVLLQSESLEPHIFLDFLPPHFKNLIILPEDKYEAMAYSDLVLAACGTANLEAALLEVPFVSFYRILPLTFHIGSRFVHVKDYSIVNILAGKRIVPELIQRQFTPENIFQESKRILSSSARRSELISHFQSIKKSLGEHSASLNAAKELKEIIIG